MDEIPSIWRTELWHPLSVHFPIALLSLAAVVAIFYATLYHKSFSPFFRFSLSLLLWTGIVTFWIAYYTGLEAYSIVVRQICDPRVLKNHLYWAYVSGWILSAAVVLDITKYFFFSRISVLYRRIYLCLIALLLLGGASTLLYTGHRGASLVYQQAAGVFVPSEDCREYE